MAYLEVHDGRPPAGYFEREGHASGQSLQNPDPDLRVSYRELSTANGTGLSPQAYTQLDLMLTSSRWPPNVEHPHTSIPGMGLQSLMGENGYKINENIRATGKYNNM